MKQETGETRDAMIEDRQKRIDAILDANKNRTDKYWIVIFAKPSKQRVENKPTLIEVIRPYNQRPQSQVGMIIGEVDNAKGTVEWEINMPQRPFDFDALRPLGVERSHEVVTETTAIPGAYITK